ncbi:MAG TPA: LacI family DNA-binding transcriptional regulator [Aggregatilineales bacterium]|nr:LacI family DNA-binding transcriptional regulator [Aggregatilineales bacterium]
MSEIAQLAGVSQATVSRVLSGTTPVAPDKQAAVLEVIERHNFRPNVAAQGLVYGKTFQVGVLTRHLGSPFFGEMLHGIARAMEETNYHPVISLGSENPKEDRKALDLLLARRVDGIILQAPQATHRANDEYLREIAEELPVIIIGRQIPGLEKLCVIVKNFDGAHLATSHLLAKGHRAIAHITGSLSIGDAVERRDGYCQALRDHGVDINSELIVEGDFSEASGAQAVDFLLSRREAFPFTAIFAGNDQMAIGARLALHHRRIGVPEEVSLVGFDDLLGTQYMIPPLTTIRQPVFYMGLMATQALLAALSGEPFHLPAFPLELVARQSVAIH